MSSSRASVSELRNRNHHVTIDEDYLVVGVEWRRALQEAFTAADALVVVLSPSSVDATSRHISSQFVSADIGAARASGKVVLPILLGGTPLSNLISDIHVEWIADDSRAEVRRAAAAIEDGLARYAREKQQIGPSLVLAGYEHLSGHVRRFHEDTPSEKSVFVMMKFPDPQMKDVHRQLLNDIWRVVSDTIEQRGLKARRADTKHYHSDLWENICVYMFGSKYGLAILEDRVASELNPNVTLEYGFMKAMNRTVGLFRVEGFSHDRADLTGKLSRSFVIDAGDRLDETSLKSAIHEWLAGLPL